MMSLKEKFANKIKIESALKKISSRLLTVRIKEGETPPPYNKEEQCFEIKVLTDLTKYSKETGIELGIENCLL